jgi:hypothetical protein
MKNLHVSFMEKLNKGNPNGEGRAAAIKAHLSGKRGNVEFYWEYPGPGHRTLLHKTQMNSKKRGACAQQCHMCSPLLPT